MVAVVMWSWQWPVSSFYRQNGLVGGFGSALPYVSPIVIHPFFILKYRHNAPSAAPLAPMPEACQGGVRGYEIPLTRASLGKVEQVSVSSAEDRSLSA